MPPTPRQTIEPSFIQDLDCPICGEDALRLKSMERYPDYVTCTNCNSQFVAEEGGERVMYGEIPRKYPRTRQFALQEWAWPEAVARRATEERSASAAEPPSQPPAQPARREAQEPPEPETPAQAPTAEEPGPPSPQEQPTPPPAGQAPTEAPAQPRPPTDLEPLAGEPEATEEPEPPSFQQEPPAPPTSEEPAAEPAQPTPPTAPEPAAEEAEEPEPPTFEAEPSAPDTPVEPATDEDAFEVDLDSPSWQPPDETEADAPEAAEPAASQEALDEEEDWLPPFGEAPEDQEEAELPEDFEPAPEMPDWLAREEPEESAEADVQPSQPPVEAEDDLAAALWDEEGAEAQDKEAVPRERDQPDESQFASDFMSELEAGRAEEPRAEAPGPQAPEPQAPKPAGQEYTEEELAAMYWTGEAQPEAETATEEPPGQHPTEPALKRPETGEAPQEAAPPREPIEPEPGRRHRVVLTTSQPNLPEDMCAHCTQTPTVAKLPVRTTLYRGPGIGERQMATFHVPICADCRDRVNAHSDERQTAQLQAHLISVLVALFLVVGALAFRVVDFQDTVFVDLAILIVLALMGYVVPVAFLLLRASRYPKPPDARYVATTLRIPGDTEGLETAYEWRSPEYASHFLQANSETAAGGVTKVKERQYESRDTEQPAE